MEPVAVRIGCSNIKTTDLVTAARQVLHRDLETTLNKSGYNADTVKGQMALLAAMRNPDATPVGTMEDPGHLLQHFFYSFLILCDPATRIDIVQRTSICIQHANTDQGMDLCVLSANLEEWRTAIINCCSDKSPYRTRLLFDRILLLFEEDGLGAVWSKYVKTNIKDNTFKLLERR